ncbi:hypothetical protein [Undibacterium griseum]|uniref:Uncharacterized protein n=1 Tax=Undibacterium griseum TaxID=2762295 RepID=A0ABR6YKL6_9BURK|nr:hypothetical protein [Undibacterium griseum]MBC3884446.1 hypothetical protein [Undibacterium griseum]
MVIVACAPDKTGSSGCLFSFLVQLSPYSPRQTDFAATLQHPDKGTLWIEESWNYPILKEKIQGSCHHTA